MWMRGEEQLKWFKKAHFAAAGFCCLSTLVLVKSFHLETPLTAAFGYTVLAMFYGSLIAAAINVKSVQLVFQTSWLRTIGKYSYGMYIIHQIARPALPFVIARLAPTVGSVAVAAVICSAGWFFIVLALAKLSFVLFESKFLRLKTRFAYAKPAGVIRPQQRPNGAAAVEPSLSIGIA